MKRQVQRGVAVITVMLIVAMATLIASFMAQQQSLWQRQVEAQFDRVQARRIAIAAVDWARAILADDARNDVIDHEGEMWTLRLPAMPVGTGKVLGVIEDRQGLFNLNNLVQNGVVSPADVARFQRLLALLHLPPELAPALVDWMDADALPTQPGGAEDDYYQGLEAPYRTSGQALSDLGELVRIKGFDVATRARLQAFVTVLPRATTINVNFAPAEVLAAAIEGLSLSDARQLVSYRRSKPFKTMDEFRQQLPPQVAARLGEGLSVSSQFFWVSGRVSVGRSQVITRALLQRDGAWPKVIWQNVR